MEAHVPSVRPQDSLAVASRAMLEANVRQLPIVDDGVIVGLVSERVIVARATREGLSGPVRSLMGAPAPIARSVEDMAPVSDRMQQAGLDGLAVVDDGKRVGLVTATASRPRSSAGTSAIQPRISRSAGS